MHLREQQEIVPLKCSVTVPLASRLLQLLALDTHDSVNVTLPAPPLTVPMLGASAFGVAVRGGVGIGVLVPELEEPPKITPT
jgi:hypothetical protein